MPPRYIFCKKFSFCVKIPHPKGWFIRRAIEHYVSDRRSEFDAEVALMKDAILTAPVDTPPEPYVPPIHLALV